MKYYDYFKILLFKVGITNHIFINNKNNYNEIENNVFAICYYLNGKFRRLDGPAYKNIYGEKDWCYEGKYIKCNSQEEFERLIKLILFW